MFTRLFIGISQRQYPRVAPLGAHEAEADRQPFNRPHRHGQVRIARNRGEAARATAAE